MKYRATKFIWIIAVGISILTTACTEYAPSLNSTEIENEIFSDWMATYKSELVPNYQSDGGYYIDLVTAGDTSGRPINDTVCWVEYEMTGYDLYGNVSITRSDVVAYQQGTFARETHYVPYYRVSFGEEFDSKKNKTILECTQLAFSNELTIGEQKDVLLYNGAEFTLYSPSSVTSKSGTDGTGGYEGQFALGTLPFVCKIKVKNVVYDPIEYECNITDAFAISNGGLTINPESFNTPSKEEEKEEDTDTEDDKDDDDKDDEIVDTDPNAWTNAKSTVPNIYFNRKYELNLNGASFNYVNAYQSSVPQSPYTNGITALDEKINKALEERFGEDYTPKGKLVGKDGSAKIWYICRFLDGFIVDTNIDEVTEIIYGKVESSGTAIAYNMETDESNYISAWYYSVPNMRFGSWSAILTTSTYAYGSNGVNGDTTTSTSSSSSSYYDYYNYYNSYYNNYYGNYGYGGYGGYGGGYGGYGYDNYYYNSYYNNYYNTDYSNETSTTTKISTEILPFTPLIFQIYVESSDDDE